MAAAPLPLFLTAPRQASCSLVQTRRRCPPPLFNRRRVPRIYLIYFLPLSLPVHTPVARSKYQFWIKGGRTNAAFAERPTSIFLFRICRNARRLRPCSKGERFTKSSTHSHYKVLYIIGAFWGDSEEANSISGALFSPSTSCFHESPSI